MYLKKIFVSLILLCTFLSGCSKKEDTITQLSNECFFSTNLDSTEMTNRLVGKWNWQYSLSGWTSQYSEDANKGLSLEFKSGGVLIVRRSGAAAQTATWSLDANFSLVTQPLILETLGPVYFCENQLLFQGGAFDGTNNYYKRD